MEGGAIAADAVLLFTDGPHSMLGSAIGGAIAGGEQGVDGEGGDTAAGGGKTAARKEDSDQRQEKG